MTTDVKSFLFQWCAQNKYSQPIFNLRSAGSPARPRFQCEVPLLPAFMSSTEALSFIYNIYFQISIPSFPFTPRLTKICLALTLILTSRSVQISCLLCAYLMWLVCNWFERMVQHFRVTLWRVHHVMQVVIEGFQYRGFGTATNKKDAEKAASRDFLLGLVREGALDISAIPSALLAEVPFLPLHS